MGQVEPAEWYDERFPESRSYQGPIQDSPFLGVWMATMVEVIRMRREGGVLVDLGCGPGHMAELVPSCYEYRGYDFSKVALGMARARHRAAPFRARCEFHHWDAVTDETPEGDIFVATEFLEHIERDVKVLKGIPEGTPVVASLPMKDSAGHARFFPTEADVRKRFKYCLDIQRVTSLLPLNSFILSGIRK